MRVGDQREQRLQQIQVLGSRAPNPEVIRLRRVDGRLPDGVNLFVSEPEAEPHSRAGFPEAEHRPSLGRPNVARRNDEVMTSALRHPPFGELRIQPAHHLRVVRVAVTGRGRPHVRPAGVVAGYRKEEPGEPLLSKGGEPCGSRLHRLRQGGRADVQRFVLDREKRLLRA